MPPHPATVRNIAKSDRPRCASGPAVMRPAMLQTAVIRARRQSWRVKMKTGNRRVVLAWCALRVGYLATSPSLP